MRVPSAFDLARHRMAPLAGASPSATVFDYRDPAAAGIPEKHSFRLDVLVLDPDRRRVRIDGAPTDRIMFCLAGSVHVTQSGDDVSLRRWDCLALEASQAIDLARGDDAVEARVLLLTPDPAAYAAAGRAATVGGELGGARLARWGQVKGYDDAFATSGTPGLEKRVFKILNRGISAGAHVVPALPFEFPFAMSIIEMEAGKGATLHSHATEEVFIPLDGALDLFWGDSAEGMLRVAEHELVSMPTGLMRGFRNENGRRFHMIALVGGWNRQSIDSVTYRSDSFPAISAKEPVA